MTPYPAFIGGTSVPQSPFASQEQTMNWHLERIESPGGKAAYALYPAFGAASFGSVTTAAANRAFFAENGRAFTVIGATFYEVSSTGTLTSRGTVATNSNPATICGNGDAGGEIFVTSGDRGYIFTLATNGFAQVRGSATTMGAHLDGYFLALDTATSTLHVSDLLDGTTWSGTQFAQRSMASDPWKAMAVSSSSRAVLLLGESTSEWWYNAGTFPFPFTPRPDGLLPFGIAAPFSIKDVNGTLMWLGRTSAGVGQVLAARGMVPDVVSTHALQTQLERYVVTHADALLDAEGDTYDVQGHSFYQLTLPTPDKTWVYDTTVPGVWVERGTWLSEDNAYQAWRLVHHVYAFGKHLAGDRSTGKIYEMSPTVYTDVDDRPIRRVRRAPCLWDQGRTLFVSAFEVFAQPGVGLTSGQGSTPQLALRISKDGGQTWGNERVRSIGAVGNYQTRARWTRCGSGRDLVFEVVATDPVPFRLVGAGLEVTSGARA